MEQQTVSVAKAGVQCSLPARTCVLAAANPIGGHYDRSKTASENLKMNPALLSRFDLIFILLDQADAHLDSLLTAHIQALHSNAKNKTTLNKSTTLMEIDPTLPLHIRLKLQPNESIDALPHHLMQKYIGYARKNIHPKLTVDAAEALKKFYLELRKVRPDVETIPVTTRQLEAMIRLTQARARADLSQEATLSHAEDVLALVRYTMIDIFGTDTAAAPTMTTRNGKPVSKTTQVIDYKFWGFFFQLNRLSVLFYFLNCRLYDLCNFYKPNQ